MLNPVFCFMFFINKVIMFDTFAFDIIIRVPGVTD